MDAKVWDYAVMTGMGGVSLFFVRMWIQDLKVQLQKLHEDHTRCQNRLPYLFADKENVSEKFNLIFKKLDRQAVRIAKMEGQDIRNLTPRQ